MVGLIAVPEDINIPVGIGLFGFQNAIRLVKQKMLAALAALVNHLASTFGWHITIACVTLPFVISPNNLVVNAAMSLELYGGLRNTVPCHSCRKPSVSFV